MRTDSGVTIPGVGYIDTNKSDDYSIKDMESGVINDKLLRAKRIKDKFDDRLSGLTKELDSKANMVTSNLKSVEAALAETNSERYYGNAEATDKRQKLEQLAEDLLELDKIFKSYYDLNVTSKVNEYNERLPQLKKGAELKLLKEQAERINKAYKEVEAWDTTESFYEGYRPTKWTQETSDKKYKIEHTYSYISTDEETGEMKYNHHHSKHEFINYWGWVKNGPWNGWPWNIMDDDINKLKSKIKELGYKLDYDESEINDI